MRVTNQPRGSSATVLLLLAFCAALLLLAPVSAQMSPPHCENCMNGMPMDGCPNPQQCGFKPILCVNCMDHPMPLCPNATWCAGVDCDSSHVRCEDGQPTASCPDPGTCNFQPISCVGCVPGQFRNACPHPEWCANNQTTYPCIDCMEDMGMPGCPDPQACKGAGPMPPPWNPSPDTIQCVDCMPGMAMPGCPFPEMCETAMCPMSMYFGASVETCVLLKQWHVTRGAQWAGVFFFVMALALLREGLTVWRLHRAFQRRQEDSLRRMYMKDPVAAARLGIQVPGSSASSKEVSVVALSPKRETPLMAPDSSSQEQQHSLTRDNYQGLRTPSPAGGAYPLSRGESDLAINLFDSCYYTLSLALGYLLMLLIMTYNIGLCIMVVLACGAMHFACNYGYAVLVRRKAQRRVKLLVVQFQDAVAQQPGGGAAPACAIGAGVVEQGRVPPTGGDHCCEDINFDDI